MRWGIGKGHKVGIVGLGGLGHMAVKFAHAFSAHVVLFSRSTNQAEDALRVGADEVINSTRPDDMQVHLDSFDFILDSVSAPHDLDQYHRLLKRDSTLCLIDVPSQPHPTPSATNLIFRRRNLAGCLIGGIRETQEMLDFCAEHGIVSDIEPIPIQAINTAYERMLKSEVKYRFVIDMSTLQA